MVFGVLACIQYTTARSSFLCSYQHLFTAVTRCWIFLPFRISGGAAAASIECYQMALAMGLRPHLALLSYIYRSAVSGIRVNILHHINIMLHTRVRCFQTYFFAHSPFVVVAPFRTMFFLIQVENPEAIQMPYARSKCIVECVMRIPESLPPCQSPITIAIIIMIIFASLLTFNKEYCQNVWHV